MYTAWHSLAAALLLYQGLELRFRATGAGKCVSATRFLRHATSGRRRKNVVRVFFFSPEARFSF